MAVLVGGLRARMIRDSFRKMIRDALTDLGWFVDTPARLPIKWIDRPARWDEPLELNSLSVTMEDVADDPAELGSLLTEDRWTFTIDFWAERDSLGLQMINDVRDILRGKIASSGSHRMSFPVYDLRVNDTDSIFYCEIENVGIDRARNFPNPWQQNWFVAICDVVDTYDHDDPGDSSPPVGYEGGY